MKKFYLLIALSALAHFLYADDIIYLNNGDEVKSKIIKISSNTIEYKKTSNIEGPTYELSKDEVVMIIYENGEKDMFIKKRTTQLSNDTIINSPMNFGVIEYDGEKLLSYNGDKITSERYIELAKANCYKAYEQYNRGQKLKKAGAICLGAGVGLTLCGIITHSAGIVNNNSEATIVGGLFLLTGLTSTATGIPLFCIGKSQIRKSYEAFNDASRGYITSSELQFRINNDGMGLALVF